MKLHSKRLVTAILYTCCLALAGCQFGFKDPYAPVIADPQLVHSDILGYSVQDRPIELITIGAGADKVLIIATIHGNENAGTPLVERLLDELRVRPSLLADRTVLIVPVANPDGYALRTRGNA
ncbi:MAG: M14 family zinc carboxypeptidase, partial [Planctomycetota bacterium]